MGVKTKNIGDDMKNNKEYTYVRGVLIMLIIVALLILIFLTRCTKVTDVQILIPTGNITVFDIDINSRCKNNNCEVVDNQGLFIKKITTEETDEITPFSEEVKPNKKVEEDEEDDRIISGEVYVDDADGRYVYVRNLDIFNHSAYDLGDKIAPGVSNVYQFVVHNSTDSNIKYNIKLTDLVDSKVTMKYRLKKGNTYVAGSSNKWVSASEVNTKYQVLNYGNSDAYSLEWKWDYEGKIDKKDTQAGKLAGEYKLAIKIYFEAIR